eukprot:s901_g25.t1
MWILPVAAFMEMRGPPLPHQVLMALNVLVEHQPGSLTIFVSHQWLGHRHPDVAGEQMDVLRSALENLIQGTVTVEETVIMQVSGIRSKFPKPADLKKAFIWMDWFSIPQVVAANDEAAKLQAANDAELAIRSIPLYVAASDVFLALVPRLHHKDTLRECGHSSWVGRGWCRLEMWCHLLSTQSDIPITVAYGSKHLQFAIPVQWINNFVHEGTFTVEADRHECCEVVRKALDDKLDRLLSQKKKKEQYRFLLAKYQQIVGLPNVSRSLNCFMTDFHFESTKSLQQQKGMGPMACAALSGDAQLLVQLLEQKAILETSSLIMPEMDVWPGWTPVHFATSAGEAGEGALAQLLRLRADANGTRFGGGTCMGAARSPGAVELLVQHRGDVNRLPAVGGTPGAPPLCDLALRAANVATMAKLIEHKADVNRSGSGAGMPPLSWLATNLSNPYSIWEVQTWRLAETVDCGELGYLAHPEPTNLIKSD